MPEEYYVPSLILVDDMIEYLDCPTTIALRELPIRPQAKRNRVQTTQQGRRAHGRRNGHMNDAGIFNPQGRNATTVMAKRDLLGPSH